MRNNKIWTTKRKKRRERETEKTVTTDKHKNVHRKKEEEDPVVCIRFLAVVYFWSPEAQAFFQTQQLHRETGLIPFLSRGKGEAKDCTKLEL
mmetsp:Transcript_8771/g.15328  ORF Transcript_8771/g.15328 Transcript_8771/m.15328 type:complete len:92 (+) Transcript_8771:89-364(+)